MQRPQNGGPVLSQSSAGGSGAKKKLVIKGFKSKPKLPDNFEQQTWAKLQEAVIAVHCKKPVTYNREELYRAVEELCIHKMGASLHSRLEALCAQHISDCIQTLVGATPDHEAFLEMMDVQWQDHCEHMITIRSIFLYLDRTYVLQNANVRSLWDMGLQLFRQHIQRRPEVEHKTIAGILALIEKERKGETINRMLVRNLLRMLVALQMYTERFEDPFLRATEIFYQAEGERYMDQTSVREFLIHVESRLQQANERIVQYLDPSTRKPLIAAVEQYLLRPHTSAVLEKGFDLLMDGNSLEDLRRMYQLFSRVDRVEELKVAWNIYIRRRGIEIIGDKENEKDMVENLLKFKARLDTLLEKAFESNERYLYSLKEAFEFFINARQNLPAELIAKYIDGKLRSGNKGTSEDEMETLLDKVMVLFRYLQGKDVFEAFYKKDLAKRLLLAKSASFDLEKSMISKLKTECGSAFTSKLEGMFKDIDLSRDITLSYSQHAPSRRRLNDLGNKIDMSVQVLTTGYWPPYPTMEVNLPHDMANYWLIFKDFYVSKYNGRQLVPQHSLGQCVVRANFPKMLVLLCFNKAEVLSFKEIKESTGIEEKELKRTLQSLACGKIRVLHKNPKGKDVDDTDKFEFSKDFSNKLFRIKINQIQIKETVEENEETHERVFRDRQYQVDAAIVRTMKARKTLSHNMLMSELFSQLRFPAKPADLKKRIESLIEREYLERDENKPQVYNYLA